MRKLEGKVAIVTGSGQRIGRGIALAYAKEGANVVIAEINPETAKAVEKEVRDLGGKAIAVVTDVSKEDQVRAMVARTVKEFGTVDILVNVAQKIPPQRPFHTGDDEWWNTCMDTGPRAAYYTMKAVFPYMKEHGGRVINFGSGAEMDGTKEMAAYAAAKAAMRGLSRVAAREWGPYGINVNVICPVSMGPFTKVWEDKYPEESKRIYASRAIPAEELRKLGPEPEFAIAPVAVFLASHDSVMVTGQTINADGGQILN